MWKAPRYAKTSDALFWTTASLGALYVGRQVARSVYSNLVVEAAIQRQDLHSPASTLHLLGNTLDVMIFHRHRLWDWMTDESKLSGGKPWVLRVLGLPTTFVLTSPEALEDVCKTQFDIFERGPDMRALFYDFVGDGIVGSDGEQWLLHRRTASHMFSSRMLRDVMDEVVKEKSLKLCAVLGECARQGRTVNLKSLISKFTSDVFTKIGFGVELNGLDDDIDSEGHPFLDAVDVYAEVLGARLMSPAWFWKLKRLLSIGDERKLKHASAVMFDLTHDVMRESMEAKKTGTARRDLLMLSLESNSGETDVNQVRDSVMNFLIAGKDTTAFSLAWIVINLNRHPEALAKMRGEMKANLPGLANGEIDVPSMDDLQKLPYLEAVVKESLRLFVPALNRVPNQSTTLSDGTFVPFGCGVVMPIYSASRMKSVWGDDAEEYNPDRWIDPKTGKVQAVSPFKFASFFAGPRQCIGMRFALLEMRAATAVVFSRFDLKTTKNPLDFTYEHSFTLPVKGPLDVTVHEVSM